MEVTRRTFFKIAGAVGAAGLAGGPQRASAAGLQRGAKDSLAILVDTTLCRGCRACEAACSEANSLPAPAMAGQEATLGDAVFREEVFEEERPTDPRAYTVVNRYQSKENGGEPVFVKKQCMHCLDPACASACPVTALEKTAQGPVIYNEDRCMGCRYCMVACPFDVPKFEYDKAVPAIRKCVFCIGRVREGKPPACASVCPSGALEYGNRKELIEVARARIYQNPGRYVNQIYGEHEAGGTGIMYLSAVPFEELGLPTDLATTPYSQLTQVSLSAVPFILTLGPPFLLAIHAFAKKREESAGPDFGKR